MTREQVLDEYGAGRRHFYDVILDGEDLSHTDLTASRFLGASLRETDFHEARLTFVQLKAADLSDAILDRCWINATDLIGANFSRASLVRADLTGAALQNANCTAANFSDATLGNARLGQSDFTDACLDGIYLSNTHFGDCNVGPFCDVQDVVHGSPSSIDAQTLIRSYRHPRIKQFMIDCGVPALFAEFMIDCAQATEEGALELLLQSTFISYGGPDEPFARRLYEALRQHDVVVFFFPESARLGERIDSEVFRQIQRHDRIILICSEHSLQRPGVLHEIRETLDRESRDGGATYLLPVTLDDYLFDGWKAVEPDLAQRLARRVVGDFRSGDTDETIFERGLGRLLDALKVRRPNA